LLSVKNSLSRNHDYLKKTLFTAAIDLVGKTRAAGDVLRLLNNVADKEGKTFSSSCYK